MFLNPGKPLCTFSQSRCSGVMRLIRCGSFPSKLTQTLRMSFLVVSSMSRQNCSIRWLSVAVDAPAINTRTSDSKSNQVRGTASKVESSRLARPSSVYRKVRYGDANVKDHLFFGKMSRAGTNLKYHGYWCFRYKSVLQ